MIGCRAGGGPAPATRIRDAIAGRFDRRYADAIRALGGLRRRLLDAGRRDEWSSASRTLAGEDFCEVVERGELATRAVGWR